MSPLTCLDRTFTRTVAFLLEIPGFIGRTAIAYPITTCILMFLVSLWKALR